MGITGRYYYDIVGVFMFSGKSEQEYYYPDRSEAFYASKEIIKRALKSPATAEFPPINEADINQEDSDVWKVASFVDSQNSFGAILRTHYEITMEVDRQNKIWKPIEIKTKP